MFKRILVANRGEIALRIVRCLREMDIESVVAYSTADKESLAVMGANASVCIGPEKAGQSYLNQDAVIQAALSTGCEAIHPGYGFLSENAEFARKCEQNGLVFIGPSAGIIEKMGDKQAARELMIQNGVKVVPGSGGILKSGEEAKRTAEELGYPVLLKAVYGGGGRGMRRVSGVEELEECYHSATAEAEAAFGNGALYLEKLIRNPRHIEVQILADRFGNIITLGERNCSMQRNHQKMLEETPCFGLTERVRKELSGMAVKAAKACGYFSAGTVEFVLDEENNGYFIEMNTRIQVEHPVTEVFTGVDLIRQQIRIAAGRKLEITREEIDGKGYALECRICAKKTGKIGYLHFPQGYGVRVDSHLYTGYEVTPFYDPMIAKIIVKGKTRLEVIRRLRRSLEETVIEGIPTDLDFMYMLTYHPEFIKGTYHTGFYEKQHAKIEQWIAEGIE